MTDRKSIYDELKFKLVEVGFKFEREQKPHRQNRKEFELVFIHPTLVEKLELNGYKVNANKFYIKPLTNEQNCKIGLVTGKSSPLYKLKNFSLPNAIDSFNDTPAWSNREGDNVIDNLLRDIDN